MGKNSKKIFLRIDNNMNKKFVGYDKKCVLE